MKQDNPSLEQEIERTPTRNSLRVTAGVGALLAATNVAALPTLTDIQSADATPIPDTARWSAYNPTDNQFIYGLGPIIYGQQFEGPRTVVGAEPQFTGLAVDVPRDMLWILEPTGTIQERRLSDGAVQNFYNRGDVSTPEGLGVLGDGRVVMTDGDDLVVYADVSDSTASARINYRGLVGPGLGQLTSLDAVDNFVAMTFEEDRDNAYLLGLDAVNSLENVGDGSFGLPTNDSDIALVALYAGSTKAAVLDDNQLHTANLQTATQAPAPGTFMLMLPLLALPYLKGARKDAATQPGYQPA